MSSTMQLRIAAPLVVLIALLVAAWHLHRDRNVWPPDGALYLRMTLQDRGMAPELARRTTNHLVLATIERTDPDDPDRSFYTEHPPRYYVDQFALFRNRPLYPWVSSLLYPAIGAKALRIVSATAYVLTVTTLFVILLAMTTPLRAAVGALVFGTEQVVLNVAGLPLTDALALLFWTCIIGAMIAYQRRPGAAPLIAIGIASIALTLARPAFFLPLGAALGAFDVLRRSAARTMTAIAPLLAALPAAFGYFTYTAIVHGPTVFTQLRWQYLFQRATPTLGVHHGPLVWYIIALSTDAYQFVISAIPGLGGILLVLLAIFGARCFRDNASVRIAIFSAATISIAAFVNPLGVERPLLVPMAPLMVILALAGFERLLAHPTTRPHNGPHDDDRNAVTVMTINTR